MIGIYKITNNVNGKVYIGQSWDIKKRWNEHKSHSHNNHFKKSLNKYGLENFTFEIIKELHETPLTQILLDTYEDFYINQFDSMNPLKGYNKRGGGSSGRNMST